MTSGVMTHIVLDVKPDSGFIGQDANDSLISYLVNAAAGNHNLGVAYDNPGQIRYLSPHPMRQLLFRRGDGWSRGIYRGDYPAVGWGADVRMPYESTVTYDGASGLVVGQRHLWQVPLTSWPARAGAGTLTPPAEASAPDLDLATIYPDQQLVGWGDGSRCLGFDGQSESVTIGGVHGAFTGTDPDWTITLLWRPALHPTANAQVLRVSGATASLTLEHLTTGYLRLTRIADDATSETVTTSRVVGLVEHALSITSTAGTIRVYSQGQQWGTDLDLVSGKAATMTTAVLGGGTWIGKIAELNIQSSAKTLSEIRAMHSTLCRMRGVPVGARETWLVLGQSNACTNGLGWVADDALFSPLSGSSGSHYEAQLDGADPANNDSNYPGWGPARAMAQDKRGKNDGLNQSNYGFHNFGSETWAHAGVGGLTTIRVARPGLPVADWNTTPLQTSVALYLDDAVERAGVPLRVVGVFYINGESDSATSPGVYYDELTELDDWLRDNYASDTGQWHSIVRKLPYNYSQRSDADGVDSVRADVDAFVADDPTRRAFIEIDDDYEELVDIEDWWEDYPTCVHGGTPHRKAEGERFVAARLALGFPATAR